MSEPPWGSEERRDLSRYQGGTYGSTLMPPEPPPFVDPYPELPGTPTTPPAEPPPPDPLTDSAAHRLMLGTMLRIHQSDRTYTDVGLLTLRDIDIAADITTWAQVIQAVHERHDLSVRAPRRRIIPGWTITHVEVLSDSEG